MQATSRPQNSLDGVGPGDLMVQESPHWHFDHHTSWVKKSCPAGGEISQIAAASRSVNANF
ncbi:MAG TPA: hypothetical protein DCR45_07940 [Gammaproteobacteria bacterium]|nr:hypothetical protein [Gammaproteobacteria bacterium]MAV52594.1 hypothetical protein [Gammaproteobacteria bacterium]HAR90890.1 hypothetical protein [Gammaproteobacteria bacterium]HAU25224.1 hypothetical protein [Gammaproteobacteria bacterium]HBJ90698.1 hypothetical protein [Gammaproteobacteria bacterium]